MKNSPLQLLSSAIIFVFAALLLWIMTHLYIPLLTDVTKWVPIIFWFICGGLGVFTPLIITGILMLRREGCEFTILLALMHIESYVVQKMQNS